MSEHIYYVENAEKNKCPHCGITYSFENEDEILYRNITLFYMKKEPIEIEVKCKQCKKIVIVKKG